MARPLFKKVDYTLAELVAAVERGEIGLPDLQRPFVWDAARVRDFFDSLYKGFPVGYLLFWSNEHLHNTRAIGLEPKIFDVPRLLIVDGQQRLTSLYAVLRNRPVLDKDFQETFIKLAFRPRDNRFEISDASIARDLDFVADISQLWANDTDLAKFGQNFVARLREVRDLTYDDEDEIVENIEALYNLKDYPFNALEIADSASEEMVADIFVRINSSGIQLKQADFVLTLLSVFWEAGRTTLEKFSRDLRTPTTAAYNRLFQPAPDELLQVAVGVGFKRAQLQSVYALLRGKDLDAGDISATRRAAQFDILKQALPQTLDLGAWQDFLKALAWAGFRHQSLLPSNQAVLYSYALFLIGRHEFNVDSYYLRDVVGRWLFMATITERYTDQPEKTMEVDFGRVRRVNDAAEFVEAFDKIVGDMLTEDFWNITLVNKLDTTVPKAGALLAFFAAQVLQAAPVLFSSQTSGDWLEMAEGQAIEPARLFAKEFLSTLEGNALSESEQVANLALVDWGANPNFAKLPPAEYWAHYAKRFKEAELIQMQTLHALPADWQTLDYTNFLAQRRKGMATIIRKGFAKLQKRGIGV